MNNFQTILVAVFLAIFAFAVLVFSGVLKIGDSGNANTPTGKVVIWGTLGNAEFSRVLDELNTSNRDLQVTYVKKAESTYQQELIESFARDNGPDLFFITPDMIIRNKSFIYEIPYASYPKKTFSDSFVDGASIYLTDTGVTAFPVVVDPMVVYYNKDLLTNEAIITLPSYWNDLFPLASSLTKKENNGKVAQSMIALGQYENVSYVKDILATLFIQNGNEIVKRADGRYTTVLSETNAATKNKVTEQALGFFTEFSNPNFKAYSWNRSLANSFDAFVAGKLVFYLGRASDLFAIQSANPNLAFDVKEMFQTEGTVKRTYGSMHALAINKKSKNVATSIGVAQLFSTGEQASLASSSLSLPPMSRALLAKRPTDGYLFTFFNSALISRSWFDPDKKLTDEIFSELIESVLSSKATITTAMSKATSRMDLLLAK